jgi:hypothetical protein
MGKREGIDMPEENIVNPTNTTTPPTTSTESKTFSEDYVKALREEAKAHRIAAKAREKQLKEIIRGVGEALLHSTRGCPLTNSSVELTDDDHIARSVVLQHKAWIRNELKSLCKQAKLPSHTTLSEMLFLLMEGAKISTNSFESKCPAKNLASSANALIEAYQQSQK